jgi:5-methylcytosine-specific restriction endonuclease McrA
MIGATEDDLKLLNAKNFIIPFESGVVVIKHWKIHNYIRGDRLVETRYKDEKALLTVKENGAYTLAQDIKEIQLLDANDKRKLAYQNSSLPYSFTYKIRRAFEGCTCPSCGKRMTSSYKTAMPTIQHNVPISKGGEHELDNISVICESCNTSIRDNETEDFNNAEVIEKWDKIVLLEKQGIKWFDNPEILNNPVDSHMSVKCQSNVSIGKDRIGKNSIDKINNISSNKLLDCPTKSDEKYVFSDETKKWNELETLGITTIRGITPDSTRAKLLKARLKQYGKESFDEVIRQIRSSDFLQGKHNGRPWQITFDWLVKPNNYPKVLEGNYKNTGTHTGSAFDNITL